MIMCGAGLINYLTLVLTARDALPFKAPIGAGDHEQRFRDLNFDHK
jgi:hypothetical protein